MSTTITLPSITGTLTVDQTDAGVIVTVTIEPGPTNRTWSASCKFWSMPEPDVLDNAARRMLVSATQSWLASGGLVHLVLEVQGVEEVCNPPTTSPTSLPPSTESTTCDAGSARSSKSSTG